MITIRLNGRPRELPAETTVALLLAELRVAEARVAVLLNEEVVPRARHAATPVRDGDVVEVITLAGGG